MTIKEAIEILRDQQLWKRVVDTLDPRYMNKLSGAVCVAIDSMQNQRPDWTPCSEGLPDEDGEFDVTVCVIENHEKKYYSTTALYDPWNEEDCWSPEEHLDGAVVAWMPKFKPDPYHPDHIVDANKKA